MAKIEQMILHALDNRNAAKTASPKPHYIDASIAAFRAHALIDAYEAVGGDGRRWRNEARVLR